ncbi:MAG: hypothetical protein MR797_06625 [Lachnospiraceae bacterium]|nr:hypothetical protein [Lachnospiraceae bacterium]
MTDALISGGAAIIVCVISNYFQNKKTTALMEYKIDQLTKKVDLHNNAISRLYNVETRLGIDEEKIKVANHRIDDLEKQL